MQIEDGITLIALVVTIVILLILAGVSINLVLNNNGIIGKSKQAKSEYGQAGKNEQEDLGKISEWIDQQTNQNGGKVDTIKNIVNQKATANGTINGEKGASNNPTIPKGYTAINAGEAIWGDGSSAPTENAVEHGLVIKDDNNNEWVWVPVDANMLSKMCDTNNKTEYTMSGTDVTTTKCSKTITIGGEGNTVEITRTTTGVYGSREPDLIEGSDTSDTSYKLILGAMGSAEQLAQLFVDEYNAMLASIEKYGGFYIGRYELSDAGVQKNKETLVNEGWYGLYNKCKELSSSDNVTTRMIWGIQWDVTCDFIANKGEKKNITDSRSWGNYNDSVSPADTGNYEKGEEKNTGSNEAWKANNIYDLAGNCSEWTQEAINNNGRCYRGGYYELDGANCGVWKSVGDIWPYYTDYVDNFLRYASHSNNKSNLKKENIKIL